MVRGVDDNIEALSGWKKNNFSGNLNVLSVD